MDRSLNANGAPRITNLLPSIKREIIETEGLFTPTHSSAQQKGCVVVDYEEEEFFLKPNAQWLVANHPTVEGGCSFLWFGGF